MIIDCISDLHGFFPNLEGGDLLIIAGDLTAHDSYEEHEKFQEWLEAQDYKKKIVVAGNHDNKLYDDLDLNFPEMGIAHLENSATEFEGLKIWGTPSSLWFDRINPFCSAFTCKESGIGNNLSLCPSDVDILISHGPAHMILDEFLGSLSLRYELDTRLKPKLFVCGHIHEGYGRSFLHRPGYGDENNTICVNASYVNENYKPVNKPIRVEL